VSSCLRAFVAKFFLSPAKRKNEVDKYRVFEYYVCEEIGSIMTTLEKLEELVYKGFKETDRKIRENFEQTDRELRQLSKEVDKVSKGVDKVSKEVGKVTDSLGRFAESMVAPAVVKLFKKRGIPINEYAARIVSKVRNIEYDIVAFNTEYVVVVSVKMTLRVSDVKEFLHERLPIFKDVFPRYKDMKVVGAVAGATILEKSDMYAMKRGLYVLAQSGDNITMLNDQKFEPRVF
jgi:hypothetical protein